MNTLHACLYSEDFWAAINVIAGATLGACFYVLVKTQPYLVSRSYDPKYNAVYISRSITGIVSGVILGFPLGNWIISLPGSPVSVW